MKILYDWLNELVELKESPEEISAILTSIGLESEVEEKCGQLPDSIVVGRVLACEKHPNADKLSVCSVDIGEGAPLQIICGAPNVKANILVPVAKIGTRIPGLPKLKKVKIRSVESQGMICSEKELGISDEHTGIMVLPSDYEVGKPFKQQYQERDTVIEIDVTPNRPDCLGHIGVAREIAAFYGRKLNIPAAQITEISESVRDVARVKIVHPEGCPRYAARVVRGVRIGASPDWLRRRIEALGLRSINNVVDASNYILFETGHPLHTFDYDLLKNGGIVVRFARDGETIITLDDQERELNPEILLICDEEKPVAIAGIMGGANSEVTEKTTNILIESAYFNPATIRRASKILDLSTEASKRFERGADPEGIIFALNRLTMLIQEIAGGEVLSGCIDEYPYPLKKSKIPLRIDQAKRIIGVSISPSWAKEKLELLGCEVTGGDEGTFTVIPPTYRPDLEREIDLIEELAQLYGMWNIPSQTRFQVTVDEEYDAAFDRLFDVKNFLVNQGLTECYTNSLVSGKYTAFPVETGKEIALYNPLGPEMGFMRTSVVPGLVEVVARNLNRQFKDLSFFEIGNVFLKDADAETTSGESEKLAIALTGSWIVKEWFAAEISNDLYRLRGILEELARNFGRDDLKFENDVNPLFTVYFRIYASDREIGYLGSLSPLYLREMWDVDVPVHIAELGIDDFVNKTREIFFREFSLFPAVNRDLSIVVENSITWGQVEEIVRSEAGEFLSAVRLYDIYRGKNIESDKKSFTLNIVFQAKDRTLKDREVEKKMERIIQRLLRELKATLR